MTPLESSEVMLKVVASPTIIILTTLNVSFMLLENIHSTGITHDDHHLQPPYIYSTCSLVSVLSKLFSIVIKMRVYFPDKTNVGK
jgi:hypothetical protein